MEITQSIDPVTGSVTANVTLHITETFSKHISNVVYEGMTDGGRLRVFMPTKDRRKARRVARRLKIRFRRDANGYIRWK
jgi:hypothetical protein